MSKCLKEEEETKQIAERHAAEPPGKGAGPGRFPGSFHALESRWYKYETLKIKCGAPLYSTRHFVLGRTGITHKFSSTVMLPGRAFTRLVQLRLLCTSGRPCVDHRSNHEADFHLQPQQQSKSPPRQFSRAQGRGRTLLARQGPTTATAQGSHGLTLVICGPLAMAAVRFSWAPGEGSCLAEGIPPTLQGSSWAPAKQTPAHS